MTVPAVRREGRLTRPERREQTRGDLLAAARDEFEGHGFHRASLDRIAEAAGYTKGAVYSHFPGGKDELFLAVLDRHIDERVPTYAETVLAADTLEASLRAIARHLVALGERDPAWTPLLVEFWTHASHRDELRAAVRERNERQLQAVASVIEALAARHGVTWAIPATEVVRGSAALARGMGLERLVSPDAPLGAMFEEQFVAQMTGLARGIPAGAPAPKAKKTGRKKAKKR
jgi:AcrR family transcriptional regulator